MFKELFLFMMLILIPSLGIADSLILGAGPYKITLGAGYTLNLGVAASCSTIQQSFSTEDVTANALGQAAATVYIGQQITANASYNVCKIVVKLMKGGTGQNVTASIYSDDSSDGPNASLGSCGTVLAADISDVAFEEETFTCSPVIALTSGTKYWIVLNTSGWNFTNYIQWQRGDEASSNIDNDADGTGTWSDYTTTRKSSFKLYQE